MARLILTSENQIQRLNGILGKVEKLQQLPLDKLTISPHEKSWCIVEVHGTFEQIAYRLYFDKINHALGTFGVLKIQILKNSKPGIGKKWSLKCSDQKMGNGNGK